MCVYIYLYVCVCVCVCGCLCFLIDFSPSFHLFVVASAISVQCNLARFCGREGKCVCHGIWGCIRFKQNDLSNKVSRR